MHYPALPSAYASNQLHKRFKVKDAHPRLTHQNFKPLDYVALQKVETYNDDCVTYQIMDTS